VIVPKLIKLRILLMTWKTVVNADAGDADHHGGDSLDKVSNLFSGVDVDDVDVNSDWTFRSAKLNIRNPANTFSYNIVGAALTGSNKTLNSPLITGTDTLASLGITNVFSVGQKFDNYQDIKAISEPSSPSSGYVRFFIDSGDGLIKIKKSNGDVVILE